MISYFGREVNTTMEEAINDRIDDDRIGMIKMSESRVEFMMITKSQCWETSMSTVDFIDTIIDNFGMPVYDAVETLRNMVKYKGFDINDNTLTLHLNYRVPVYVKFPSFGEPKPCPAFMWAAVTKDAGAHACVRADEEQKRIEEQKIAEALALQRLRDEYKRWKKKNPTALVCSIPEKFAPILST